MTQPTHLLLQQPEGKTLEFKRDLSSPRNVLKTLVAFANSAGVRLRIWLARHHVAGQAPTPVDDTSSGQRLEFRLESKLAAKVLMHLGIQPMGKADLARALGHASVSGELHKQIRRLPDSGYIQMPLPDKPHSRLQCYRLPDAGKKLMQHHS